MGSLAGGEAAGEVWITNRMRQIDDLIAAARRELEAALRGRDPNDLSDAEKKPLKALADAIDHGLSVKSDLERQRATPSPQPVEALAKRADVQAVVAEYRDARDEFDAAVCGRLGKLNSAEQQRIRVRLSAAEIRMQKVVG